MRESKLPGSKTKTMYFNAKVWIVEGNVFYVQFEGRDYVNRNYAVPQDKLGSW